MSRKKRKKRKVNRRFVDSGKEGDVVAFYKGTQDPNAEELWKTIEAETKRVMEDGEEPREF